MGLETVKESSDFKRSKPSEFDSLDSLLRAENKIRNTVTQLRGEANPSVPYLDLSLGDPSRFGGVFSVPEPLSRGLLEAIQNNANASYSPAIGTNSARQALADRYKVDISDVFITCGCSVSLDMSFRSLANPGSTDIVMVPSPGFPLYETLLSMNNIQCVRYTLDPASSWRVNPKDFDFPEKENVKAVLVCNPSNPTGTVFDFPHLVEIVSSIKRHCPNAVLLADQIYEDVVFGHAIFHDLGPIGRELEVPTVTLGGLSKGFFAPGWRMGWMVFFGDLHLMKKRVANLCGTNMGSSTPFQHALTVCLQDQERLALFRKLSNQALKESSRIVCTALQEHVPQIELCVPNGAMYLFFKFPGVEQTSSLETCSALLKDQGLLLLPGDVCFNAPTGYMRMMIAIPPEVASLAAAKLIQFFKNRKELL